jgi:very-short-patch-repair endonuclease
VLKQKTTKQFIIDAIKRHGKKYNYSKIDYKNSYTKVKIKCPIHGWFKQRPINHLQSNGCNKCGNAIQTKPHGVYIEKAKSIHGNRYDYSNTVYKNVLTKIKVRCKIHGEFTISPRHHIDKKNPGGCMECSRIKKEREFIKLSNKIHNNKYTYDKVFYKKYRDSVIITCPVHGDFEQTPNNHLAEAGCPICSESKGERRVSKYLDKMNIKYIREYRLPNSRYRYDFYLPELNMLIEYDGRQHVMPAGNWGGVDHLVNTKKRDQSKNDLAKLLGIPLIRIPHTEYGNINKFIYVKIKRIYKYKVGNKYFKSFLELAKYLKLDNNAVSKDYEKYEL